MSGQLKWRLCRDSGIAAYDPYTCWLAASRDASYDFDTCQSGGLTGGHNFLALSSVDHCATAAKDGSRIIWPFKDAMGAKKLSRIGLKKLSVDACGPGFDLLAQSQAAGDANETEVYLQLAPMEDREIPTVVDTLADPGFSAPTGIDPEQVVITAVIDDNINIAHERFLDPSGEPRTDFAWIQDGDAAPNTETSHVLFGREIKRQEIKTALDNSESEDEALRKLRLLDFTTPLRGRLATRWSHGTYVLDKAAGYASDPRLYQNGAKPTANNDTDPVNRRIIAVQLPYRVSLESSGALYALYAVAALRYIVDRAKRIAEEIAVANGKKIPLVINFSYGLAGGPHNGQHLIERAVDQIVKETDNGKPASRKKPLGPTMVPMAVGNRFTLQGHAHAIAAADGAADLDLIWHTQPQDRSPNYLEIWVPRSAEDRQLTLRLEHLQSNAVQESEMTLDLSHDPQGAGSGRVVEARCLSNPSDPHKRLLGRVSVDRLEARQFGDDAPDGKIRVLIALSPTLSIREGGPSLPAGDWSVKASVPLAEGEYIEAWIQRDDTPPGFRRQGHGSHLVDQSWPASNGTQREMTEHAKPLSDDAGLDRYGSISGIATGDGMIRVAGSRFHEGHLPTPYSGASSGNTPVPHLSAPSDRSRVFGGVVGASTRSGGSMVVNGTSVSAPYVARAAADFLAGNTTKTLKSTTATTAFLSTCASVVPITAGPVGDIYLQNPDLVTLRGRDLVLNDSCLPADLSMLR